MHWMTYVKHAYEVVLESEAKECIHLDHETEAYVVHLWARYIDKPLINKDPVCIKLMSSLDLPNHQKKEQLKAVGDECLLINGLKLQRKRWPSDTYYKDMGQIAFQTIAYTEYPPEIFFEELAVKFDLISRILNNCTVNRLHP